MNKDFSFARARRVFYYRIYRRAQRSWIKALVAYDEIKVLRKRSTSFRSLMAKERQRELLSSTSAAKLLESKEVGVNFAALNEVPVPSSEVFSSAEDVLSYLKASTAPKVVKPLVGWSSRDVFIVHASDDIFDLYQNRRLHGFDELKASFEKPNNGGWIVEQFLASPNAERFPAHDLKFYSFYGEIGIVLEIRRNPDIRFCWWDQNGKNIGKGKHNQALFQGDGFSEQVKEWAERLSKEIPVPFIRIDFLRSGEGSFFGEFTPVPGNLHHFPYEIDRHLGKMYLEAESRLLRDLWNGKPFEIFRKTTRRR